MAASNNISIAIVGDAGVGKTAFCLRWKNSSAPDPQSLHAKKESADHARSINVDGREYTVQLWDLDADRGNEVNRSRALVYPNVGAVIVLFALDSEPSLQSCGSYWANELNPEILALEKPRMLVGTKLDLRATASPGVLISASKAKGQMSKLGAKSYHECSPSTGEGVDQVVISTVRAIFGGGGDGEQKSCCILS